MLVPRHLMNDAAQIAKRAAQAYRVGATDKPSRRNLARSSTAVSSSACRR